MTANPSESLIDYKRRLNDTWRVVAKDDLSDSTGGSFSVGYIVADRSDKQAFLKALDFSEAMKGPNPTLVLQSLTSAYNYEKRLLDACRGRKLDRVAVSIDDGVIPVGDLHPSLPVPYLIFERARGDVRSQLDVGNRFELAFCLRTLHHCATGIQQLHGLTIAHQDLKPSNVLVFDDMDCRVADLGRSSLAEYPITCRRGGCCWGPYICPS